MLMKLMFKATILKTFKGMERYMGKTKTWKAHYGNSLDCLKKWYHLKI